MFAYIRGTLQNKQSDFIVLESNGIGYKIFTSLSTLNDLGAFGDEIIIYTHLYVREDIINLYGFGSKEELSMFELLISVSGVGPKAAISLLSCISPSKFSLAVVTDDVKTLTKAPGIGNKMAQRIILELKDKIKKENITDTGSKFDVADGKGDTKVSEAISALMVLGYTSSEASKAVSSSYTEDMDLEDIIKNSLKALGSFKK